MDKQKNKTGYGRSYYQADKMEKQKNKGHLFKRIILSIIYFSIMIGVIIYTAPQIYGKTREIANKEGIEIKWYHSYISILIFSLIIAGIIGGIVFLITN